MITRLLQLSCSDLGGDLGACGISPLHWGMQWMRADVPRCHEHCDCCSSTGCPESDHQPDWTWGYCTFQDDFWMCPRCFEQFRELMCWHVFEPLDPNHAEELTVFGTLVAMYWPDKRDQLIALVEQATAFSEGRGRL